MQVHGAGVLQGVRQKGSQGGTDAMIDTKYKIPSEMEVAPRFKLLTLLTLSTLITLLTMLILFTLLTLLMSLGRLQILTWYQKGCNTL